MLDRRAFVGGVLAAVLTACASVTQDTTASSRGEEASFTGSVFVWRFGGPSDLDQAVRIDSNGKLDLSQSDVGWVEEATPREVAAVAAGLDNLDWEALEEAAIDIGDVPDGELAWNIARFDRELVVLDRDLPDPRPDLFDTAATLMDERITDGPQAVGHGTAPDRVSRSELFL